MLVAKLGTVEILPSSPTIGLVETTETMMSVSDNDLLQALREINDPELGINIVDLGLVYRAQRGPDGIDVALMMTAPSCPLGESMVDEARDMLSRLFPDANQVHVELIWDPPWSPERMSDEARKQLGFS